MFLANYKHELHAISIDFQFSFKKRKEKRTRTNRFTKFDETHAHDNIWFPPLLLLKKKKKNNSLIRLDKPENIFENDQRNGFPVQGRSKTRGCESLALDPPLTSVYFRWPRLFPPFFSSLSPGFSRPSTPLFLPFFHRPKGRKPVLEHSTPSRPREPNRVPRFIRLSRYTTASTCMKPGETKPMMEDHGSAASRYGWGRETPRKEGND